MKKTSVPECFDAYTCPATNPPPSRMCRPPTRQCSCLVCLLLLFALPWVAWPLHSSLHFENITSWISRVGRTLESDPSIWRRHANMQTNTDSLTNFTSYQTTHSGHAWAARNQWSPMHVYAETINNHVYDPTTHFDTNKSKARQRQIPIYTYIYIYKHHTVKGQRSGVDKIWCLSTRRQLIIRFTI